MAKRSRTPEEIKRERIATWRDYKCQLGLVAKRCQEFEEANEAMAIDNEDKSRALEIVRYWLHDVLVLNRPMQQMPRDILRIVENVL